MRDLHRDESTVKFGNVQKLWNTFIIANFMKRKLNNSFQIQLPPNFYGNLHMYNHINV